MKAHIRMLTGRLDRTAGSHTYNLELASRLVERDYRVSLIAFSAAPESSRLEVRPIDRFPYRTVPLFWRYLASIDHAYCGLRLAMARLDQPDLTIGAEHFFLRAHRWKFPDCPWIYLPHSLRLREEVDGYDLGEIAGLHTLRTYEKIQLWALKNADATLRFTRYGCDVLKEQYKDLDDIPFVVIPPGVDLPPIKISMDRRRGESLNILSVGSLSVRKNISLALQVLASLEQRNWIYHVVGGGNADKYEKQAAELGIADRVVFHGHQDDIAQFYSCADLLLVPSLSESFGLVLIEAMSHALPVVAMRADGGRFFNPFHEIISDGIDGYLADSEAGMALILKQLLQENELRHRIGTAARKTVLDRFSWDRHIDAMENLFHETLSRRS